MADTYGDDFFAGIDGVTNALDNVLARESRGPVSRDVLTNRSIHGQAMCVLPKAAVGIGDARY
jgi:hypothetical protein